MVKIIQYEFTRYIQIARFSRGMKWLTSNIPSKIIVLSLIENDP